MNVNTISETLFCFEEIDYFRLDVVVGEDGALTMLRGIYDNGRVDVSERTGKQVESLEQTGCCSILVTDKQVEHHPASPLIVQCLLHDAVELAA